MATVPYYIETTANDDYGFSLVKNVWCFLLLNKPNERFVVNFNTIKHRCKIIQQNTCTEANIFILLHSLKCMNVTIFY